MGIKEIFIEILRSRQAQSIDFTFRGSAGANVSVNGTSFARVAQAIQAGTVNVLEGGAFPGKARYSSVRDFTENTAPNTFYVGMNDYHHPLFHGLVIHESVHASFDLTRSSLPWVDNEAAAYIAQGIFLRNARANTSGLVHVGANSEPYLATRLVDAIRRGGDTIDGSYWMEELRNSILADPIYHDKIRRTFSGDG